MSWLAYHTAQRAGKIIDTGPKKPGIQIGIVLRWGSAWIGAHWSPHNKRLCLNVVPFVTIWFAAADGVPGTGWRLK